MTHLNSVFLLMTTDFLRNKNMDKWVLKCRNICHRAFIDEKNVWCFFTEATPSYYSINSGSNTSKSNCIVSGAKPKGPTAYRREKRHNICLVLKNGYILKIPAIIGILGAWNTE